MAPRRPIVAALVLLALLASAAVLAPAARAEDPPLSPTEAARKESIERLEKDLKRMANNPRAEKYKDEITKALDSLGVLGGPEAGKAS